MTLKEIDAYVAGARKCLDCGEETGEADMACCADGLNVRETYEIACEAQRLAREAAKIVHCKDCKHYSHWQNVFGESEADVCRLHTDVEESEDCWGCVADAFLVTPDYFCGSGERKEVKP
jgi:hypothetical protein